MVISFDPALLTPLPLVGLALWVFAPHRNGGGKKPPAAPAPEPEAPDPYKELRERLERWHADRLDPHYWVLRTEDGTLKSIPVPQKDREAMLARWKAEKGEHLPKWWIGAGRSLHMHAETKDWLEARINEEAA